MEILSKVGDIVTVVCYPRVAKRVYFQRLWGQAWGGMSVADGVRIARGWRERASVKKDSGLDWPESAHAPDGKLAPRKGDVPIHRRV